MWALDIEPETIDRKRHLDLAFWSSRPPEPLFDLVPRHVINDSTINVVHARRIEQAGMTFPLDATELNSRLSRQDHVQA
ncbi:MAG: hypothetical protein JKY37_09665 [Nannocystaceae bacterium]|nr:hypothetical protein [Nannocystaceae bacterium]